MHCARLPAVCDMILKCAQDDILMHKKKHKSNNGDPNTVTQKELRTQTPKAIRHARGLIVPRDLPELRLAMQAVALEHPVIQRPRVAALPHGHGVGVPPSDAGI